MTPIYKNLSRGYTSIGGTTITVTGVNFTSAEDLKCIFGKDGEHGESQARYITSEKIRCQAPSLNSNVANLVTYKTPYLVPLEVSNFVGHSTKNHLQLSYRLNPVVTTIEPESIPSGNNFTITLYGENIANTDELGCRFGTEYLTRATWLSSHEVQ